MKKSLLLLFALLIAMPSFVLAQDCQSPENIKVKIIADDPNFNKKYKVTLSWDAVEGADAYAVYFNSKWYTDMWLGNTTEASYEMGSDVEGDLFYLSVRTFCDETNGIISEISEQIPVNILEDAVSYELLGPENLTAKISGPTAIELTWDAVANASSYFVYRNGIEVANILGNIYTDNDVVAGVEYCYTVTSMGVTSESVPSNEACITIEPEDPEESISEYENNFKIFPNPVENNLSVIASGNITEISIYNLLGVNVYSMQHCAMNNEQLDINISDLNSGVYFIRVSSDNGDVVRRFVKK